MSVAGLKRMTTGSVAERLILSCHTGRLVFEADWLHCKRDALSSNRKVDGLRLTGSTQACHS